MHAYHEIAKKKLLFIKETVVCLVAWLLDWLVSVEMP
jgi:hypothetical protein